MSHHDQPYSRGQESPIHPFRAQERPEILPAERRWTSEDLVQHVFGDIVDIPLASRILLTLLRHRLVEATQISQAGEASLPLHRIWVDACVEAATCAFRRLQKKAFTPRYTWSWIKLTEDSVDIQHEREVSQLLNIIGALGYSIASRLDSRFLDSFKYRNRFTVLKRRHQDSEFRNFWEPNLGIVALPVDAFKPSSLCSDETEAHLEVISPSEALSRLDNTHDAPQPSVERERSAKGTTPPQDPYPQLRVDLELMLSQKTAVSDYPLPPQSQFKFLDPSRLNWASIAATGEVFAQDPDGDYQHCPVCAHSVGLALQNMATQAQAQPHLRYVLGLAISMGDSEGEVALLRADGIGSEECPLNMNTGRGVLEIVRLALGFAVANEHKLGLHPYITLEDQSSDVDAGLEPASSGPFVGDYPADSKESTSSSVSDSGHGDTSDSSCRKWRVRLWGDHPKERSKAEVARYTARKAVYLTIPEKVNLQKETRYYLHYLASNRRSQSGRSTRVWCAYQEIQDEQSAEDLIREEDQVAAIVTLKAHGRVFAGPYALKLQNADMSSPFYKENIENLLRAKVSADPEGSRFILLQDRTWKCDSILEAVRGLSSEASPEDLTTHLVERTEVVSVSAFKRTLPHYTSIAEVGRATSDAYEAILWLDQHFVTQRDISNGNILLAAEEPTFFKQPHDAVANGKVIALYPRKSSQRPGVYGLLHDFDMTYRRPEYEDVDDTPSQDSDTDSESEDDTTMSNEAVGEHLLGSNHSPANVRMGTPPYMAIARLYGAKTYHLVRHDAESLFCVLYLFPFTARPPPQLPAYSQGLQQEAIRYDRDIAEWLRETSLEDLACHKLALFSSTEKTRPVTWRSLMCKSKTIRRLWPRQGGEPPKELVYWRKMVVALHRHLFVGMSSVDVREMADDMKRLSAAMPP